MLDAKERIRHLKMSPFHQWVPFTNIRHLRQLVFLFIVFIFRVVVVEMNMGNFAAIPYIIFEHDVEVRDDGIVIDWKNDSIQLR